MTALQRILRAANWGLGLAIAGGCGGNSESDVGPEESDAATTADGSSTVDSGNDVTTTIEDGSVTVDSGSDVATTEPLEKYPTDELGCSGPSYDAGFGYHGQCCWTVGCITPEAGQCPAVGEAYIPGFPSGSGSCQCGDPPEGPYAPWEASEGACCYVFSSIGCDGRPLLAAGVARVARVVRREDWSA